MTPSEMHWPVAQASRASHPATRRAVCGAGDVALTVNGAPHAVPAGATVAELLRSLDLDPRTVVVEHNGEIVHDRASLGGRPLHAGDVLELVHFVGGG
jgi:thiamine biosynthesis protein ThiS